MNDSEIKKAIDGDYSASVDLLKEIFIDTYKIMNNAKTELDKSGIVLQRNTAYGVEIVKNPASDIYSNALKIFTKLLLENTSAKDKEITDDNTVKADAKEKKQLKKMYANLKKMSDILK